MKRTKTLTAQESILTPNPTKSSKRLAEVAAQIRELQHGIWAKGLPDRYKIAQLVAETLADAEHGDKGDVLRALAGDLRDVGLTSKTLANHALVAKVFSKEEFTKLSKLKGGTEEKSTRLSWTHFVTLAGKAHGDTLDGRHLNRIVTLTLKAGLTDRQMSAKWDELYEPENVAAKAKRGKAAPAAGDLPSRVGDVIHRVRDVLATAPTFEADLSNLEAVGPVPELHLADLATQLQALGAFVEAYHARVVCLMNRTRLSSATVEEALTLATELNFPATGELATSFESPAGSFVPFGG